MFGLIFSIVFIVAAALSILIGVLKSKKLPWQYVAIKIFGTLLCVALVVVIATYGSVFLVGLFVDNVIGMLPIDDIDTFLKEVPSSKTLIKALMSMFIAPALFMPLYGIFRPIMAIATKSGSKAILKAIDKSKCNSKDSAALARYQESGDCKHIPGNVLVLKKANWISAVLGGVCGFITLCVLLTPMVGAVSLTEDAVDGVVNTVSTAHDTSRPDDVMSIISDLSDGLAHNACTATIKALGGGYLYDFMTSCNIDGTYVTLKNEIGIVSSVSEASLALADEKIENSQASEKIRGISTAFDRSALLPRFTSELLGAAASDWKEGNSFHGIGLPGFGDDLEGIRSSAIDSLSKSTEVTVKEDFGTIIRIIAVMVEKDAFNTVKNDPMSLLGKEDVTESIFRELFANERLAPMVDSLADFGIEMLLSNIDAPKNKHEAYLRMIEDAENVNVIYPNMEVDYEDPESVKAYNDKSAEAIITAYVGFFESHGIELTDNEKESLKQTEQEGGSMQEWTKQNIARDADIFKNRTQLVFVDEITEGANAVENIENEAKAMASAFAEAYKMIKTMTDSEFEIKSILENMGTIFDEFKNTDTVGGQKTAILMTAVLQSPKVHDKIGFTVLEATASAKSINNSSASKGYALSLRSLALMVDVVEAAGNSEKDTRAAVDAMLDDLTPESADIIKNMATPNVIKKNGVPEKSAEAVSDVITNTFDKLATAKSDGMSDEEYKKEAAAVSNMMEVLMSANESEDKKLFSEEEGGMTVDDYVNNIMDSSVMSETLVETVYGDGDDPKSDPLSSGRSVSQSETEKLLTSLNERWESSDKSDAEKRKIIALGAMINISLVVDDDGVRLATPAEG